MTSPIRWTILPLLSLACQALPASDVMVITSVDPGNQVGHGVEVQSVVDASRHSIDVAGPEFLGVQGDVSVTWYAMTPPIKQEKSVRISAAGSAGDSDATETTMRLGPAEYLVIPAQMLATGSPAAIADDWDILTAYRVLPSDGEASAAAYLCVPTQQWHHDARVVVHHADRAWLVVDTPRQSRLGKATIIDGFGLNPLHLIAREFEARPVTLIDPDATKHDE